MMHDTRRFSVAPVATAEELAEKLSQRTWCRCNGFQLGDLLFLNDSFSEDGAQEFAVVKDGRQIESITFGWCTEAQALQHIQELQAGTLGDDYGPCTSRIEAPDLHQRCPLCA